MLLSSIKQRAEGGTRERFLAIVDALFDEGGGDAQDTAVLLASLVSSYPRLAEAEGVRVSADTMRKRVQACGRLAAWAAKHEKQALVAADVSVPMAWRFIDGVGKGGATARTQRKIAGELSAVWATLQRRGFVSENPWGKAKPQRNPETEKTGRAFTREEVAALLAVAPDAAMRLAILVGVYTGLRLGDIRALRWEDVDFARGVLALKPSKTARHGVEVRLPLAPPLRTALEAARRPSGLVCGVGRVDEAFGKMLARAGIKEEQGVKLSFHCFRHTFATWIAQAGATEAERMALGGWTNATTAKIYNHADSFERAREIVGTMPEVMAVAEG